MRLLKALVLAAFALCAFAAFAQTIKIGFITSYSGLNGNLGPYMERAVRLYIKQHEKELPPGVKSELLARLVRVRPGVVARQQLDLHAGRQLLLVLLDVQAHGALHVRPEVSVEPRIAGDEAEIGR